MDLHGRQIQFMHNIGIFDLACLVDRLAFEPFRRPS
jgi:hypothetical protein